MTAPTLLKRVTQMLVREKKEAAPIVPAAPAAPVESEEKKAERLEAYKKFCEEQSKVEAPSVQKKMKFRAKDFNAQE